METIKKIAAGVVRFDQTEKGLCLHRFTEGQTARFYNPLPYFDGIVGDTYFGDNCLTTAGISLDFVTNSRKICLKMAQNHIPSDAKPGVFDLYVNGKYRLSFPYMDRVDLHFAAGEKRVTIYCPHFNFPTFSGIEYDGEIRPAGQGVDVLLMGDSITHGVGAFNPGNSYANTMARELGVRILNQAQSGYVYDAETIEKVCDPKLILCAYGVNDRGRKPFDKLESETNAFYERLREVYPQVPIAAILPVWTSNDGPVAAKARDLYVNIYTKHGLHIIDGLRMIPHDKSYFMDGVHPNNYGGRIYGKRLAAALKGIDKLAGLW